LIFNLPPQFLRDKVFGIGDTGGTAGKKIQKTND
jgi:hypothetical protein